MEHTDQYSNLCRRKIVLKKRRPTQEHVKPTKEPRDLFQSKSIPSRANPFKRVNSEVVCSPITPDETRVGSSSFIPATPEKDDECTLPADVDEFMAAKRVKIVSKFTVEDSAEPKVGKETRVDSLPPDLSISGRARFYLSDTSLERINEFTSQVKENQNLSLISFLQNRQMISSSGKLAELLNYYSYPDLPWMNLFPRKESRQLTQSDYISVTAGYSFKLRWDEAVDSILAQIISSYTDSSAYIICDSFNIMIHRCDKCSQTYSLLSPSTRGLRNALTHSGIKFKLPLYKADLDARNEQPAPSEVEETKESTVTQNKIDTESVDCSEQMCDKEPLDAQMDEDGEPLDWLESIGLNKENFPSLRAAKVQMESESFRHIDYQPASTLLIEQSELMNFIEFIKKFDKITATTGQFANIPPTILSRTPFRHGQLSSLQLSCGKHQLNRRTYTTYLDLTGPVLPNLSQTIIECCLSDISSEINISLNKLTNSHVYNVHNCSQLDGNPFTFENFTYKNQQHILNQQNLDLT